MSSVLMIELRVLIILRGVLSSGEGTDIPVRGTLFPQRRHGWTSALHAPTQWPCVHPTQCPAGCGIPRSYLLRVPAGCPSADSLPATGRWRSGASEQPRWGGAVNANGAARVNAEVARTRPPQRTQANSSQSFMAWFLEPHSSHSRARTLHFHAGWSVLPPDRRGQ